MRVGLLLLIAAAAAGAQDRDFGYPRAVLSEAAAGSLVAAIPPLEKLDGEDAVVLYRSDDIILKADGRISRRTHSLILLLTDVVIDEFGDPRIPFDAATQEVVIHRCRTYTPDGRIVDAAGHAFNQVTPHGILHCVDELERQEMVITHVGIELGCVIELDVEVRDLKPHSAWLEGLLFLQEDYPCVHRLVVIRHPGHLQLQARLVHGTAQEHVSSSGGMTAHTWRLKSLPGLCEHDDGAGGRLTRTHLLYSTCPTWEYLQTRLGEHLAEATLVDQAMRDWITSELECGDPLTRADQLAAVLTFTSELQGTATHTFEQVRRPRSAPRSFDQRCGNEWDRLVLARALLEEAGFAVHTALRGGSPEMIREVPALMQFDGLLLEVESEGEHWFADPRTGTLHHPQRLRHPVLVLTPEGPHPTWHAPVAPGGRARVEISAALDDEGHLTGSADLSLTGDLFPYGDCRDLENFLKRYASRLIEGAEVTSHDVVTITPAGGHLRFTFRADSLVASAAGQHYLSLMGAPVSPVERLQRYRLTRTARTAPIFLGDTATEEVTWRLAFPEQAVLRFIPPPARIETAVGSFVLTSRVADLDAPPRSEADHTRALTVAWKVALTADTIAPGHYGDLKRLVQAYGGKSQRLVIFGE